MPELPLVGVTAIIAGMAAFNRDAAAVEGGLLRIGRASDNLERQTVGAFGGAGTAFGEMAAAVATGATLVTGALLLGAGASIKFAADFQQGMALTQALSGATDDDIAGLTSTIEDLARRGTLGLSDLSEGARDLARSGVTVPEIMGRALKAVDDLATASGGEISLDSAAKLVANSMHAFGLSVTDVDRITTAAAVVAQNSSATFTDFGTAVAIAGASFKSVGFSIEDLSIAETLLTNKGISASTAATALRGEIQRLELPSKAGAAIMQQYGIHLFDASGKAVGFRDLLKQLNDAFSDEAVAAGKLTEKQRDVAVATLGLQRTGASFLVLANEGTDGFDRLAASFGRLKAADLVEIVLKPLNAQAEIAFNNIQVLARAFGSAFLPALQESTGQMVFFLQSLRTQDAVDFGKTVVDAIKSIGDVIGPIVDTVLEFADAFGLTAAAGDILKTTIVGLGLIILGTLLPPVLGGILAFGLFLVQIALVGAAIAAISGFVADSATAIANWAQDMGVGGALVADVFRVISDLAHAVGDLLRGDFSGAATFAGLAVHDFGDGLKEDGGKALDAFGKKLDEIGSDWAPWAAQAGPAGEIVTGVLTGVHQVVEGLAFLLQGNFVAASADAQRALQTFGGVGTIIAGVVRDTVSTAFRFLTDTVWPLVLQGAGKVREAVEFVGQIFQDTAQKVQDQGAYNDLLYVWGQVLQGAANLIGIVQDLIRGFLDLLDPLVRVGSAANDAHGNLDAVATISDILSGAVHVVTAAMSIMATEFAIVTGAIEIGVRFFVDLIEAIGGTIAKVSSVLGPLDDLHNAWNDLVEIGGLLGQGIGNLVSAFSTVTGTVNDATGGFDLLRAAADVLGFAIGLPLALLIKGLTLAVEAAVFVIKGAAQDFEKWTEQVHIVSEALQSALPVWGAMFDTLGTVVHNALDGIGTALVAIANNIGPIAEAIGFAIVSGISNALVRGVVQVAANAASLATAALNAAKDAVGAHSPARDFEVLGNDMAEGINIGLLQNVPKAKEAARTYGDSILQELATFTDGIETASRDISSKLEDIAIKAATSTASAIDKANHDIQTTIDQTQDSLNRLNGAEADPSSFVAREAALRDTIDNEKRLHNEAKADADLTSRYNKELALADSTFKKNLDLEDSKFHQAIEDATTDKDRARAEQTHKDNLANLTIRHNDDIAAANQRYADAKTNAAQQRVIDAAERDFTKQEDAKITAFKEQQLIEERDTKISTIQQAEDQNVKTVQQSADKQRADLLKSYENRIGDLQSQLLNKIPPLTEAQAQVLQEFLDNVQTQTEQTTQEIVDAMGQSVVASVTDVGNAATLTLGTGGIVPTAASVATTAFNVATNSADDLRGDTSGGILGAKDAATQISFVLQQLDDKMPHLVAGIHDLVEAIAQLHDKDVTITTHHVDVGSPSSGSGSGSSSGGGGSHPGESGPGGIYNDPSTGQPYTGTTGGGSGGGHVLVLQEGGIVPGPLGVPMFAIVHGGEFVTSVNSEISKWARQMVGTDAPTSSVRNYNVNATYANAQSPASVEMDMRALVALSRGV